MRAKQDLARTYTVTIERLSHEGRGVARYQGKTVFVAGALPGEEVVAKVTRRHRRFDEAATVEILHADPARVTPRCPYATVCGGCSFQHLDPASQLAHKEQVLLELLRHQAGAIPDRVLPQITGPLWGYRRRARLSVRVVPKKGGTLIGFREKASHYVTAIEHCAVLVPSVGLRLTELRGVLDALSIPEHIPQIEVIADDTVTVLVIRHLMALCEADLAILREFEHATGLSIYLQAGATALAAPLTTPVALSYRVGGIEYGFGPGDFVQINAVINAELIATALILLAPAADDTVLDLFCGVGNFTLPLAQRAGRVVGVEHAPSVVTRARDNAARNGISNVEFVSADLFAAGALTALPPQSFQRVLLDPPRTGAEAALRALDFAATQRVLYISCNPVTLARDAAILIRERGFRLSAAGVIDMFPHTAHVESIAVFDRAR